MKTKFWLIALIVFATLILSACTIDISVIVNPDGSGALGMTYKFTAEDLKSLEGMGMTSETICEQMGESEEDFTFVQEQHGDETWCVASRPIATIEELKTEMGGDGFTVNALQITNNQFTFDADANMSQEEGAEGFDMGMLNITFSMTAPGKVTNHNGDESNGNTVTWKLPIGSSRNLHLESNVGSSGPSMGGGLGDNTGLIVGLLLCCCCLIVIVIIVVVVVVVVMRRKQNADVNIGTA